MNYGNLPKEFANADSPIVIVPVPYDGTSTWLKGADKGPKAILDASPHMEFYDIETKSEVYRRGIFTDKPVLEKQSPEKMALAVQERVQGHLQRKKFVVVLGGEHSVSIGTILAHAEAFPGMAVLQLDAHTDCRESYEGSSFNHACVMARARENCQIVQVGIRAIDSSEKLGKDVFFAEDLVKRKDWIQDVVKRLPKKVYLTLDLDVFDPSIMPSTGTPEPGGLGWYEVLALIKEVVRQRELVGCDIVELMPHPSNKAPDFMASKLLYKILSYRFEGVK